MSIYQTRNVIKLAKRIRNLKIANDSVLKRYADSEYTYASRVLSRQMRRMRSMRQALNYMSITLPHTGAQIELLDGPVEIAAE